MTDRRQQAKREFVFRSARETAEKQDRGFEPTCLRLPPGIGFWRPKAGNHQILIVPFLAGVGNPNSDAGYPHYERTYYPHRNLGLAGKEWHNCLHETFRRRCPVCVEAQRLLQAGKISEDTHGSYRPQVRQLFNIIDCKDPWVDPATKDKYKIQIYDSAFFKSFGQLLQKKIKAVEAYEYFFHPLVSKGGMLLQLLLEEQTWPGGKFVGVTNLEILPRKMDLPMSIIEEAPCLDDLLIPAMPPELAKSGKKPADFSADDWGACYNHLRSVFLQDDGGTPDGQAPVSNTATADDPWAAPTVPVANGQSQAAQQEQTDFEWGGTPEGDSTPEEPTGPVIGVGSPVSFSYKGKDYTGVVEKINPENGLLAVAVEGMARPYIAKPEDVQLVLTKDEALTDDDWGIPPSEDTAATTTAAVDDGWDDAPPAPAPSPAKPAKPAKAAAGKGGGKRTPPKADDGWD